MFGEGQIIAEASMEKNIEQFFTSPKILEIRNKLEKASKEELESIIKNYNTVPLLKKIKRMLFNSDEKFKYLLAKSILGGEYKGEIEKLECIIKGKKVERFSGNLEEFEKLKNAKYEIIDTNNNNKTFNYDVKFGVRLETFYNAGKLGIEALINCQNYYVPEFGGFGGKDFFIGAEGIPVRKIKH